MFLLMTILPVIFLFFLVNVSWAQTASENVTISFGDIGFLTDPRLSFVPPIAQNTSDPACGSSGSGYGHFRAPSQNISLSFTGTRVSVVFYPWSDRGSVVMSLDGAIIDTMNTAGTTITCGERTWTSNIFPSAPHVFTITSNGTLAIYRIIYLRQTSTQVLTTGATFVPSVTVTSSPQPTSAVSSSNLTQLQSCKPCGKTDCSYGNVTDLAPSNFTIMASTPVTNCGGGKESLTFTVAGSIEIGETWTTSTQLGISVGQINLGTSVEFSRTQTTKYSKEIKIPVEPGQKAALVFEVTYVRRNGKMKIGASELPFPVTLNQPVNLLSYGAERVLCNASFAAINMDSSTCKSGAQALFRGRNGSDSSFSWIIATILGITVALL